MSLEVTYTYLTEMLLTKFRNKDNTDFKKV